MDDRVFTTVKWIGPNTPIIKLLSSGRTLTLSKRELQDLQVSIDEFMEFYFKSFNESSIDNTDEEDF